MSVHRDEIQLVIEGEIAVNHHHLELFRLEFGAEDDEQHLSQLVDDSLTIEERDAPGHLDASVGENLHALHRVVLVHAPKGDLIVKHRVPEGPPYLLLRPRPFVPPPEFAQFFKHPTHAMNVQGLFKPGNHGDGGYFHVRGLNHPLGELISKFIQCENVGEMIVGDRGVTHFKEFPDFDGLKAENPPYT
jgi:hypothetical protein